MGSPAWFVMFGLVSLNACSEEPQSTERPVCDVPAIFEASCAGGGCHGAEDEAAGLDLESLGVADRVSMQPATQCAGLLADPTQPTASVLYQKVLPTNTCGATMPIGRPPLTDAELDCLVDWIAALLPPPIDTEAPCVDCVCEPELIETCYDGAAGTENQGICTTGERECGPDGTWGPCIGQVVPSVENCTTPDVDEDCDGATPLCSNAWSVGFSNPTEQAIRSVAFDSAGNVFAFGDFTGTVDFGGGPLTADGDNHDVVLVKLDSFGTPIWAAHWGDSSNQYATQVAIDADDNVFLLGRAFGKINFGGGTLDAVGTDDVFIAKLTGDGLHLWSGLVGGADPDRAERMAIDGSGDLIVTGTFTGEADFGFGEVTSAGARDAFVLKLDGGYGLPRFVRIIGGVGDDYGFGVDTNAAGDVFVAGRFGETVAVGTEYLTSEGGTDIYLAKLTSTGLPVWSTSFGSTGDDLVHDLRHLTVDGEDRLALVGHTYDGINFGAGPLVGGGDRDLFVAMFDDAGSHRWSALYGDETDQFDTTYDTNTWMNLAMSPSGTLWVGGGYTGTIPFGPVSAVCSDKMDMLVFSVDPSDGTFQSMQSFGGEFTEILLDLELPSDDFAILGGRFFSLEGIAFGPAGSVSGAGLADGVVAKIPL